MMNLFYLSVLLVKRRMAGEADLALEVWMCEGPLLASKQEKAVGLA